MNRNLQRLGVAAIAAVVLAGTAMTGGAPVSAAPAPIVPATADTLSADALPTVQVDGVVWSQAVVGNTVYAGGRFNNARPAGAAAGTNLTPRGNLLAYDITTGNLNTSFAPNLNGQVLSVAASPDGSRIYVVGDFTTANGVARRRVAAYSTATGQLIASFAPSGPNSQARAVIATNTTVYVGGGFLGAGGTLRGNLIAYRASDGAILNWNPNADYTVWALAMTPDGSAVYAGGSFQNVGGQPAYGLAKIDGVTGAVLPWTANSVVRNAGEDAGITSLRVQGGFVYGTTWHFGPGGNLEGTFKASTGAGDVAWVTDCHGDVYSSFLMNGVVYAAGHAHYCGNMGGGHPQYPSWRFQNAQAWTQDAAGEILNEVHGYPNWHGVAQAPSIVHWLPEFTQGTFTGQGQAAWSVIGNGDYMSFGGEFPRINGGNQQGLVRFARRGIAPRQQGPRFTNNQIVPTLVPTSSTSVRVSWLAGFDRDDRSLQYQVFRAGVGAARYTANADSNWWTQPALGFVDTGLTPGVTYTYRIVVRDGDGNVVNGASRTVTMPASVPTNAYADQVRADGARIYWPLNETSGTTNLDRAGVTDGQGNTGIQWSRPGAVPGDTAAALTNNEFSRINTIGVETAPDVVTIQAWIRTTTTNGGRILGFSDVPNGNSGHRDRQLYMDNGGRVLFGVRAPDGSNRTVSGGRSYNDGQWHQITATLSPAGMVLYVDGVRVGRRADTTGGEAYVGSWRVGGDSLGGWPNQPSSINFVGDVDEIAVYPTALTSAQIIDQYELTGRTTAVPNPPADAYGAAVYQDDPDLYWRLGESSGTTAVDSGQSLNNGTYRNGVALGQPGAISGNTAADFNGSNQFVASNASWGNPTVYSQEAWFKTSSNQGGKIIGFGNQATGNSSSYDRHVYMQNDGRLVFGVWTGQTNTITSPNAYNDGAWHHMVATQSGAGMKLFIDGDLVGTHAQTQAQPYSGYWRVGGDVTWGSSSNYLDGVIDEVAVYSYELGVDRVQAHYALAGGVVNQLPVPAFTSSVDQRLVTFNGTGSSDPDGTVTAYAWSFGDGHTASGATPSHVFAAGTYTVSLTVTDNHGANATITHDVTVAATPAPADAYGAAVVADQPVLYWRLDESTGAAATDISGAKNNGTYYNGYTLGNPGAIAVAPAGTAAGFDGGSGFASSNRSEVNPTVYSEEAWFQTTTTSGGKIIGFGNQATGNSSSYDRHVYMQDDGRLVFGTWTGQMNTITTPDAYNDGGWHHVVATQSGSGMRLYVDGELVGTNPQTGAEGYTGYWKVGGDVTWGSSSNYFNGRIDEVAVYLGELSAQRVAAHYAASQPVVNQPPVATLAAETDNLTVDVDGAASHDPDGTIATYAWDFGDGGTAAGATATHTYAAAGTYTVSLTVTDDQGAQDTATTDVVVTAPPAALAADAFGRTVTGGFGTADVGGAWTVTAATRLAVGNGVGTATLAAGTGPSAYLNSVSVQDVEASVRTSADKVANGGGLFTSLVVRRIGTSDYRVKVRVNATNIVAYLVRTVNGTETILGTATLDGGAYQPGEALYLRVAATGSGTTTLEATVWRDGQPEPASPTLTATDTTAALQAPGAVGLYLYLSGSATNGPVVATVDDFDARAAAP